MSNEERDLANLQRGRGGEALAPSERHQAGVDGAEHGGEVPDAAL